LFSKEKKAPERKYKTGKKTVQSGAFKNEKQKNASASYQPCS